MTCDHAGNEVTIDRATGEERCDDCAPTYTDDVIAVMRDTIAAQREKIAHLEACNEQLKIGEAEALRALDEARAQACLEPYGCWKELRGRLLAARTLLEDASGAIDEACYPVWWEQWRQFLDAEGTAP